MDDTLFEKALETIQKSCTNYREHCCDCMLYDPDSKYCALNIEELGGFPFYWDLDKFFNKEQYHDDDD